MPGRLTKVAMSRELSVIHARENIRVNALCPGPLNTPLLQDFLDTEEKKQRRLVHVPVRQHSSPPTLQHVRMR